MPRIPLTWRSPNCLSSVRTVAAHELSVCEHTASLTARLAHFRFLGGSARLLHLQWLLPGQCLHVRLCAAGLAGVGRPVEPVCRRVQVYLAARVCCPKHGRRRCAWCMSQLDVRVPMRKRAPPVGEPLGKPKQPHGGFATVIVLVCGLVVVLLEVVGALVTGQCDVVALADWQAQCDGLEADGGCAPRGCGVAATA